MKITICLLRPIAGFVFMLHASITLAVPYELSLAWEGGSNDPTYDSTRYEHILVSDVPYLFQNIDFRDTDLLGLAYPHWNSLSLENGTAYTQPTLRLRTLDLTCADASSCGGLDAKTFSITLETLSISDLTLESSAVKFRFFGSNNRLILNDATLKLDYIPEFSSQAPLSIEFAGGESTIDRWNQRVKSQDTNIGAPTTITVASGAVGRFLNAGNPTNIDDPANALRLSGPSTIDVDGGTLIFEESFFRQENGTTNIRNGGQLDIKTSGTSVYLDNVNVTDGSTITVAAPNSFQARKLNLTDSTLEASSGTLTVRDVEVAGNASFVGTAGGARLDFETFTAFDSAPTFINLNSIANMNISGLVSESNTFFNVNNSYISILNAPVINGSTFNLSGNSALRLFGSNDSMSGNFNFAADSALVVGELSALRLSPLVNLNFSAGSKLIVNGSLTGSDDLGDANLIIEDASEKPRASASLSPGINSGADRFGQIATNGDIQFRGAIDINNPALVNTGLFDGAIYLADVGVSAGIVSNDELIYNSGTVDLSLLKHVYVRASGNSDANDFVGKEFTIIRSLDAASTGGIFYNGQSVDIVEDPSMPALVDFTVVDSRTNGKDDLTLVANVSVNNLQTHSGVSTENHNGVSNLLINSANTGNASTTNSLNTLTNAQVASHIDTIHPEPYSSYMTISLEHSDMTINTVLGHASAIGYIGTGQSNEAHDKITHKRSWLDANYAAGDVEGDAGLGDFNYSLSSITVGQDIIATPEQTLGLYFSYGTQEMDEHDRAIETFRGDVYHFGAYLNRSDIAGWALSGVLGYAYGDNESKRQVVLGNTLATPSADYDSHSAYAGIRSSTTGYKNKWVTLSPELGLSYIYYARDKFKESGDPNLSLILDSASTEAIVASAGLNARFASFSKKMSVYPLAFIRYEHDFYANANSEHEIDAAIAAHPDYKQSFVGQNRGADILTTGLGIGSDVSSALQVNSGFIYSKSNNGNEWGAGFNLEYHW